MKNILASAILISLLSACGSTRFVQNPTYASLKTKSTIQLFDECLTLENNLIDITPKYVMINDTVSLKILKIIQRNPNSYVYVLERHDMIPDCLEVNKVGDRILYYYGCQELKSVLTASVVSGKHMDIGI